jgi:hypothetical protein
LDEVGTPLHTLVLGAVLLVASCPAANHQRCRRQKKGSDNRRSLVSDCDEGAHFFTQKKLIKL